MTFEFNNTSPIYIQLVEQLKIKIISGKLSPLDNQWYRTEVQEKRHLGLTRAGVNLVYRFDMKKVNVFDCN